jgi:glycosyltransferase involved in cell wall biosynthesis
MRVLHVTGTFYPDGFGGIEEVIRQICINTSPLGVESKIFTLSSSPSSRAIDREGFEIFIAKKTIEIGSCGFSIKGPAMFKELVQWADIIHYHFPWPFADFLHFFCKVNKKSIVTYHSDIVRQKVLKIFYQPLMHKFLQGMDKIIATSPNYLQSSATLQKYKEKVTVIPIGISEKTYPIPSEVDTASVQKIVGHDFILFIGMFRQYKGLNFLLEALSKTNKQCVIAGTGPLEKQLKRKANSLGLCNVHFVGEVNEIDKVILLKLCIAVVFSSHLRSEAFGVSLVEGSMFGKPLISTELGTGTSFINLNGKTGIIVPPGTILPLVKAIDVISNDRSLSKKMGLTARAHYEKNFTGIKMGQEYSNIYNNL